MGHPCCHLLETTIFSTNLDIHKEAPTAPTVYKNVSHLNPLSQLCSTGTILGMEMFLTCLPALLSHEPSYYVFVNFSATACSVDTNQLLGFRASSVGKPPFTICSQGINSRLITNTQPPILTTLHLSIHPSFPSSLSWLQCYIQSPQQVITHQQQRLCVGGKQTASYSSYLFHLLQGQQFEAV